MSLKRNISYNFIYQLLVLALPLLTAPYLARVIGARGIGVYSYSYAIMTYFSYFVKLGLDNYGNRSIAACQSDRNKRTKVFWSIYAMQMTCFALTVIVYLAYGLFLADDRLVAFLQGLNLLSVLFDVNWFFFGIEQFGLTVMRNTVIKVLTTISIFMFVKGPNDVYLYIAVMCVGSFISELVLWQFLRRYIGLYRPRMHEVVQHIKPNMVLFISVIAISVYNVLSKIVLGSLSGPEAVGFFEGAVKIASVPIALVGAVGTVMLPRTSALVAAGKSEEAAVFTYRTLQAVMAFTCVFAFGIPAVAVPFTSIFYGTGFGESARCLIILSGTIPLLGFGNVIRTQYLIPNARDSVFVQSAFGGAIASLIVGLALDPFLGAMGAAFASVAAEATVLVYQVARVRKEIPIGRYLTSSVPFLVAGALMALILSFIPPVFSPLVEIGVKVFFGCFVYAAICFLLKIGFYRGGRPFDRFSESNQ